MSHHFLLSKLFKKFNYPSFPSLRENNPTLPPLTAPSTLPLALNSASTSLSPSSPLDLKFLLMKTMAKSVILVEDLDQFMEPESGATTTVTALGIQSFMDGIISACCREERVMVFTMNNKECVNPNLLQPSRVAVHIHFSVCDFSTIKTLVSSYLGMRVG